LYSIAEPSIQNPSIIDVFLPISKAHAYGASGGVLIEITSVFYLKGLLLLELRRLSHTGQVKEVKGITYREISFELGQS